MGGEAEAHFDPAHEINIVTRHDAKVVARAICHPFR